MHLVSHLPIREAVEVFKVLLEHQKKQDTLRRAREIQQGNRVVREMLHHFVDILEVRIEVRVHRPSLLGFLGPTDDIVITTVAGACPAALIFIFLRAASFPSLLFLLLLLFSLSWLFQQRLEEKRRPFCRV